MRRFFYRSPDAEAGGGGKADAGKADAGDAKKKGAADDAGEDHDPKEETKTFDEEYVKKLRAENKERRLALKDLEKKQKDLEAKVAEFEASKGAAPAAAATPGAGAATTPRVDDPRIIEMQRKAEQAETRALTALSKAAFTVEAVKLGVIDPDKAFRLIDLDDKRLDVDLDSGEVDGMDEVVKALVKGSPWLAQTKSANPPPNGSKAPGNKSLSNQSHPSGDKHNAAFEKAKQIGGTKGALEYLKAVRDNK